MMFRVLPKLMLICIPIILSACSFFTPNTQEPTITHKVQDTPVYSTPIPTVIDPTAYVPVSTPKLNVTQESSPILTLWPTLTLTKIQHEQILYDLLATNDGCELPCWWGIIPGESQLGEIGPRFSAQGFEWDNNWLLSWATGLEIFFGVDSTTEVIQSIRISSGSQEDRWGRYSLDQILLRHGLPSRVQIIYPFRPDPSSTSSYHLFLFYEEQGMEIDYIGNAPPVINGKSQFCAQFDHIYEIRLFLYQQKDETIVPLKLVIPPESVGYIAEPDTVYELTSWQQATGTSLEYFLSTFSESNLDACVEFLTY